MNKFPLAWLIFSMVLFSLMVAGRKTVQAIYSPSTLIPARNAIIYTHPIFQSSGTSMTSDQVASRFSMVIMARKQLAASLPQYLTSHFNGDALVYLIAENIQGPSGLSSLQAQSKTCTDNGVNPATAVYGNNVAMDTGDFCRIHDAIVTKTCLSSMGYADICPTESWFLHKADGSRYVSATSGFSSYHINPGDNGFREFFARRALRELANTESATHPSVAGVDGLYMDNIELSWTKAYNQGGGAAPKEYATNCEYVSAERGFTAYIHNKLHSGGYSFPVWANMISDPDRDQCFGTGGSSWLPFDPYLEGGLNESYALSWGNGPASITSVETNMKKLSDWVKGGNGFVAIAQGTPDNAYNQYAYTAYLMATDGVHGSYKYSDGSSYADYLTLSGTYPDYLIQLGQPTNDAYVASTTPKIWKRDFQCGSVTTDVSNHVGNITLTPNCTPNISPLPSAAIPGDANGDRIVDNTDFNIWSTNYGKQVAGPVSGDFNSNGTVDGVDYAIWFYNYSAI